MVHLPDVTLIAIAGSKHGETISAIRKSLKHIQPARTILITNMKLDCAGIEVVYLDRFKSWEDYNLFVVKELYKYFNTDHCLVIQWDGYVIDGKQWSVDFLNYDYIGAKWLYKTANVGNGGFSLRSRRFQEIISYDQFIQITSPEDEILCRLYRGYLEETYDIKYADEETADKFSFELNQPEQKTFGFHGFHHKPFKPHVVLKRSFAMGDVVMLEPVMDWWGKMGFQVVLDIDYWLMPLFANLKYKPIHLSQMKCKKEPGGLNFDGGYENKPKQLVLQSYYDHVGIEDGEIRNSSLNYSIPRAYRLFKKYAVVHINKTKLPYRNIEGIAWEYVQIYLEGEGYTVIQIGKEEDEIGTWVNTMTTETLMAVIAGADLFIGSDSGPAQIAVACNVQSVIMFGSVNPTYRYADLSRISPVQSYCPKQNCYHEADNSEKGQSCLLEQSIPQCATYSSDQIINAIKKLNMPYCSEAEKIKDLASKYLHGTIIDIGSAGSKITPEAIGVDGYAADGVNIVTTDLYNLSRNQGLPKADVIFSSHCLEHLTRDTDALTDWAKLLKSRGFLILYLPSSEKYNNHQNEFHFREYTHESFLFYFKRTFCGEGIEYNNRIDPIFEVIESGNDFGFDRYSFYLIAQKL